MNFTTLQTAVDSTKMLFLLGNIKAYNKITTILRANIDNSVYTLVRGKDKAHAEALAYYIQNVHDALVKAMGKIEVERLVNSIVGGAPHGLSVNTSTMNEMCGALAAIAFPEDAVFYNKEVNDNILRGQILHKFSSVVRNDSWNMLLLTLGTANSSALSLQLVGHYGSKQGRAERAEKVLSLLTDRSTAPKTTSVGTSDMIVRIELSEKTIRMHPEVAPFLANPVYDVSNARAIDALISEATKSTDVTVFRVGAVIEEKIAVLVKKLENQEKVSALEQEKKKREALVKKEDLLVKKLTAMGEQLKELMDNPKLLERAFAEMTAGKAKEVKKRR